MGTLEVTSLTCVLPLEKAIAVPGTSTIHYHCPWPIQQIKKEVESQRNSRDYWY